jgi:hypothetical protein
MSDVTHPVGAKISDEQFRILEGLRQSHGFKYMSDLIRDALGQYAESHKLDWPDYEFVDNDMRKQLKIRGRGKA